MIKDKAVAFNSRSVLRNATDKMSLARFPTSSATLRLKESREGAPRTLGRQKVPRDQRLRKYLLICGPSKFAAQARSAYGPRDRTQALHGPRTQAYGETKYKKENYYKFWTEPRPCMVLGLKPMGKPTTKIIITSFGTEPRPCMVLGPKPMGETNYLDKKRFEFCKMGYLIKMSGYSIHGLNTIKG